METPASQQSERSFCGVGEGLLGAERMVLAEIGSRLTRLAFQDPASLERGELADMVAGMAADTELVGAVAGRFMDLGETVAASVSVGEKSMVALVNAKGRVSRTRACQLRRAGTTIHRFPTFHTALLAGQITTGHIDLIHGLAKRCDSSQLAAAEKDLAALAVLCTPEEFREQLAVWEAAADPTEHLDEFLKAEAARHFWWARDLFGNTHFGGCFDPISGEQVIDTLTNRQKQLEAVNPDVKGEAAAHDALVDLILNPDSCGAPRARIELIAPDQRSDPVPESVPADLDLDDVPGVNGFDLLCEDAEQVLIAEVEAFLTFAARAVHRGRPAPPTPAVGDLGFGSIIYPKTKAGTLIPPAVLERYRPTATTNVNWIDPDGNLVDDQPGARHFTARQKRLARLRDNHCQHPGCRMPGRWCEHDHIDPHSRGGLTIVVNQQLLCGFHHRWKHRNDPKPFKRTRDSTIQLE